MEEGTLPTEQRPDSEKVGIAKLLFGFTGLYERWKNEMPGVESRSHKPFDSGPQHEPDFEKRLHELEGRIEESEREPRRTVYYGNHHAPPEKDPERHQRRVVWDLLFKIAFWVITAAVGFAYGRLWDHEHRISVIEGREVPHGSP
jgi:hypothetical protein